MESRAEQIRAGVDRVLLRAQLADWPDGDNIGARTNWGVGYSLERLPKDAEARRAEIEVRIARYCKSLAVDLHYCSRIKSAELEALSDYDLVICYSGNVLIACQCTLRLKDAHISFNRSELAVLYAELARMDAEQVLLRPQLSLF